MMRASALLLLIAAVTSCRDPGATPRAAAEAFLDAHYVRIDLEASLAAVSGLARQKVEREIELTRDVQIDDQTFQPRVNYRLERAEEGPAAAQYAYELTIRPPGVEPFRKLVMVTVRVSDTTWSVTNYSESDMP